MESDALAATAHPELAILLLPRFLLMLLRSSSLELHARAQRIFISQFCHSRSGFPVKRFRLASHWIQNVAF